VTASAGYFAEEAQPRFVKAEGLKALEPRCGRHGHNTLSQAVFVLKFVMYLASDLGLGARAIEGLPYFRDRMIDFAFHLVGVHDVFVTIARNEC
jgi:hypothetical protein